MTDRELMQQWLRPGAIVPVEPMTIRILIDALRERLAREEQEPVAWLWQHSETGRTRVVMPDTIITTDATWHVVGPLYLGAAPQPAVQYQLSPTDIYDFAGWLTTRPGVLEIGSSCEAGSMAEAVGEYLKTFPERFTPQPAIVTRAEEAFAAAKERGWVGLTEGELAEFSDMKLGAYDLCLEVEAKLKEKNG